MLGGKHRFILRDDLVQRLGREYVVTVQIDQHKVFDVGDVLGTTLYGAEAAGFLQEWGNVMAGQTVPASEIVLTLLFDRQLLRCPSLEEKTRLYERTLTGSDVKPYACLSRALGGHVESERREGDQTTLPSHRAGGGDAPALTAVAKEDKFKKKLDGARCPYEQGGAATPAACPVPNKGGAGTEYRGNRQLTGGGNAPAAPAVLISFGSAPRQP